MLLQVHLYDSVIAAQLYQRMVENLKDSTIEIDVRHHPSSAAEIALYSLPSRSTSQLAACGIAVVKLAGVYFITIEQGLTGKKDIYPVDSVYTASELNLTKLGLKEKVKLGIQLATTYKLKLSFDKHSLCLKSDGTWNKSSIPTTPAGPSFGRIGTLPLSGGQPFKPWEPNSRLKPMKIEGLGQSRNFWDKKTEGDELRNTTFDQTVSAKPHAGGYHARDVHSPLPTDVDMVHGDNFQNRSFDNDPFGHDTTHGLNATQNQLDKDFEGSGPLLFTGGPVFNRDPVLSRDQHAGVGFKAVGLAGDFDADETFALSAHHISNAQFDLHLGGLRVIFDEHILLFRAMPDARSDQLVCRFEINLKDVNHVKFAHYISSGGAVNLETKLAEQHDLGGCNIVALIDDNIIDIKVDSISAKTFNRVAQIFSNLKHDARKPRDEQGNIADVELEDDAPIPKINTHLFIRIKDEGVYLDVNGVEYQAQVKAWDDKALLLTTEAIGYPTEAELKMLATTLKANYGGKAKGDISIHIGENDAGERGLVLEFGSKPRFSHLRANLEKHLVK